MYTGPGRRPHTGTAHRCQNPEQAIWTRRGVVATAVMSDRLGWHPPKTVRCYETMGLLPVPRRAANGFRCYTDADLTWLRFIRGAQAAGLSLHTIDSILDVYTAGVRPCLQVQVQAEQQVCALDRRIAELLYLRERLLDLAERARDVADEETCDPADICSALSP